VGQVGNLRADWGVPSGPGARLEPRHRTGEDPPCSPGNLHKTAQRESCPPQRHYCARHAQKCTRPNPKRLSRTKPLLATSVRRRTTFPGPTNPRHCSIIRHKGTHEALPPNPPSCWSRRPGPASGISISCTKMHNPKKMVVTKRSQTWRQVQEKTSGFHSRVAGYEPIALTPL
jgi:hypothetical protein